MCSPIPGCDLRSVNNPTWGTTIENNNPLRDITSRHDNQQMSPVEPFSKLAVGNTLPLYKPDPPSFGTEDYDYTLAEPASSSIQDLAQPLESTTVPPAYPESSSTSLISHDDRRHEPKETQKSPNPARRSEDEVTHSIDPTTTGTQSEKLPLLTTTTTQTVAMENHRPQQETGESTVTHSSDRTRVVQDTAYGTHTSKAGRHVGHHKRSHSGRAMTPSGSSPVGHNGQEKVLTEHKQTLNKEEQGSYPSIQFSPTKKAPVRLREDGEQPRRQPLTLNNYQTQDVEDTEGKFSHFKETH